MNVQPLSVFLPSNKNVAVRVAPSVACVGSVALFGWDALLFYLKVDADVIGCVLQVLLLSDLVTSVIEYLFVHYHYITLNDLWVTSNILLFNNPFTLNCIVLRPWDGMVKHSLETDKLKCVSISH